MVPNDVSKIILFSVVLLCVVGLSATAQEEAGAVITSPGENSQVDVVEDVQGRLGEAGGYPVVVVHPLVGSEPWYVQDPVERVGADGSFSAAAHFGDENTRPGTRFRICLIIAENKRAAKKFTPGMTIKSLPPDLPRSGHVTVSLGSRGRDDEPKRKVVDRPKQGDNEPQRTRTITFGGLTWEVKHGARLGPGPNAWSDSEDHVWLDDDGHLHLRINERGERWSCAEVVGPSLGYGEYRWVFSGDLAKVDPQVVLGLFVYQDTAHEIDYELSRWGSPDKDNSQFVVQPFAKDSMHRFDSGKSNKITCSFDWNEKEVRFRCWHGEDTSQDPLAEWTYSGRKVPKAGKERVRANLWLYNGRAPKSGKTQEFIIEQFQFTPSGSVDE